MTDILRVAIVGAGPAGFYTADTLVREKGTGVHVELIDRLPTPYGLVRAGVAPDHQHIKAVTRVFDKIAASPSVCFHGGVTIGDDIDHATLAARHHAVVYATGAPVPRPLGIPGEGLSGFHTAADVVPWYNGHPEHSDRHLEVSGERVVIVGNGNVALDITRILASRIEALRSTDIADHAVDVLSASRISEIVVVGRRGPAQAAFTRAELTELAGMEDVDVIVPGAHDWMDEHLRAFGPASDHPDAPLADLYRDLGGRRTEGRRIRVVLRFFAAPVEVVGESAVEGITLARTELRVRDDGTTFAVATDTTETLATALVIAATGYVARPIATVPYEAGRGVFRHKQGRVSPGVYVAGWAKRGPSGVIGTNRKDAVETAQQLLEDFDAGLLVNPPGHTESFHDDLAADGGVVTDYQGWILIDERERGLGVAQQRPRVKLTSMEHLLAVAGSTEQ
ncbi:FAD-dependent oxidoreductase [Rhodococcus sp. JVH1]|uniref:FAD-dependent oxidoreductase n=1 Tax=Rhodococcus sp. JVH1 TaxID=745408 RepID=UPI000271FE0F|nr:FAD-dependent oxidoreductase [Rhodococcus sp. JVH1]EJI98220.1 pyridine nucleotide-disulfide oxidoreductase family protein [Rhodococcus sp. JVH1]